MKAPDTKTILNITLVIAIIVVGKKLGEKFGLFKTTDDKTAEQLDTGATGDTSNVTTTAPTGLALNPNYWKNIYASIKPKVTGAQILKSLTILGTNPLKPTEPASIITGANLLKLLVPPYAIVDFTNQINTISKVKKLNTLEQTYAILAAKIYDSKGIFADEPDKLNSVFQQLNSKAQISYLSFVFNKIYDKDLFTYLTQFLNSTELTKISNIIKNKAFYKNI
jgi:hypothetical protein